MALRTRHHWSLQDAKSRFSELVRRVLSEGPQVVTRGRADRPGGQDAVVVVAAAEYERLVGGAGSLLTLLQRSPLAEVELEFDRPLDPGRPVTL